MKKLIIYLKKPSPVVTEIKYVLYNTLKIKKMIYIYLLFFIIEMSYSPIVMMIIRRYRRQLNQVIKGTEEYKILDLWINDLILKYELTNEDAVNLMRYYGLIV